MQCSGGWPTLRSWQGRGCGAADAHWPIPLCEGSRHPPFANCAKDGPPTALVMPTRSKAWATRPGHFPIIYGRTKVKIRLEESTPQTPPPDPTAIWVRGVRETYIWWKK